MIIWTGWGLLVAVFAFGSSLLMELITEKVTGDDDFYQTESWPLPVALIIAGVLTYIGDRLTHPDNAKYNTLFFIPMKYWAPILFIIALATLIF